MWAPQTPLYGTWLANNCLLGVKHFCNAMGTILRALEVGTPWLNKAELDIKLMKEAVRKDMREVDLPLPFWDYCLERRVQIYNLMARDHIKIRGIMPHIATTGVEGDISNLCQYKWYDWCHNREHTAKFHTTKKSLGMCWVLQEARAMRWPSVSSEQIGMWS